MTVRLLCLALVGVCAAGQAQANPVIASPEGRQPPAQRQVPLIIEPGPDQETRLIVPARVLKGWLAAAAPTDSSIQTAGLGPASLPTVAAGLALTAVLALGGLWLRRPHLRRQLLGGIACVLAGLILFGVSCSPRPVYEDTWTREKTVGMPSLQPDGTLAGQVLLESDDKGDRARLAINREALELLAPKPAGPSNP